MRPPPVATTSKTVLQRDLDQSALSRFAGFLSGARRLKCEDDGKQVVGVLSRSNSPLG